MASIVPSLSLRSPTTPRFMVLMLLIMATALATKRSRGNTKVNNKMTTMPTLDMALLLPTPAPASSGAHPSNSRDQATLTGNRGQNTNSVVVQDDDVYGGI